ncbi:9155_t:CDS:2 [Dentiscutata erythropus]|uniref:9155_t:CDS:1 n=1 Tax=Dentiscutata erythropus TaxID=1348616 RepID=A0A9N9EJF2_9GLOM|nr:9155_t:CDS:2 [Dentiscutata erythropus]
MKGINPNTLLLQSFSQLKSLPLKNTSKKSTKQKIDVIKTLRAKNKSYTSKITKKSTEQKTDVVKTLRAKNKSLESKNKSLESKNKGLESKNKSLESNNKSLESKNKSLESKNKSLESKNKSLESEVKKLKAENKKLQNKCQKSFPSNSVSTFSNVKIGKDFENEISRNLGFKGIICTVIDALSYFHGLCHQVVITNEKEIYQSIINMIP